MPHESEDRDRYKPKPAYQVWRVMTVEENPPPDPQPSDPPPVDPDPPPPQA